MKNDIIRNNGFVNLGSRFRRIGEKLQSETQTLLQKHDVPIQGSQFPILLTIQENGPSTVGDIANALGLKQPGVTRNIGTLAKQGVVSVLRGEKDQRTKLVGLTDLGRDIIKMGTEVITPLLIKCVSDVVSDERASLLEHLDHLEDALQKTSFVKIASYSDGD